MVAFRRFDCKNKLTIKIAFSEHLLEISRSFLPRGGLFVSLAGLEEGRRGKGSVQATTLDAEKDEVKPPLSLFPPSHTR